MAGFTGAGSDFDGTMGGTVSTLLPYTVTTIRPSSAGNQAAVNLKKLQDQANKANEQRYQQLLALADLFGTTALQRNQQLTTDQLGATRQDLISRGLGNTTILPTMLGGVRRRGQEAENAIREKQAGLKSNIIAGRSDNGPNLGLYAQLLSQPR